MVVHTQLTPDLCKCRNESLPALIARWRTRTLARVQEALEGDGIDFRKVRAEAELLKDLADGGTKAFQGNNPSLGHLCDDCPYRKRTPLKTSLAVDQRDTKG